jgi:KGK domain
MVNKFELLECNDEDVISFDNLLSKFSDFKNEINHILLNKIQSFFHNNDDCKNGIIERFKELSSTSIGDCNITLNLSSPRDGEPCEILRLGSHQWQKGKLRFNAFIEIPITKNQQRNHSNIEFTLEFAPDIPESPLDDLRQIINNQNNEKNTAN